MNAVHQTFAPFLASICPPPGFQSAPVMAPFNRLQAQCDAQAAIIKRYQPPKTPIGQMEYVYRFGPLELICHLEYEDAERGIDSPDIAADTTLIAAYANGMEVSEYLDANIIKLIETKAAASLEE